MAAGPHPLPGAVAQQRGQIGPQVVGTVVFHRQQGEGVVFGLRRPLVRREGNSQTMGLSISARIDTTTQNVISVIPIKTLQMSWLADIDAISLKPTIL